MRNTTDVSIINNQATPNPAFSEKNGKSSWGALDFFHFIPEGEKKGDERVFWSGGLLPVLSRMAWFSAVFKNTQAQKMVWFLFSTTGHSL